MNFILNVVFQFILVFYGKRYSYKVLIMTSLIISSISMLLIPIVVVLFKGLAGFIITSIIIVFQGLANAIVLSCFYGIIGYLPDKYRVAFSTGSGIAGILMNFIKYIILLIFGDDNNDDSSVIMASIVFFCFSVIIIIICIVFVMVAEINLGSLQKSIFH